MPDAFVLASVVVGAIVTVAVIEAEVRSYLLGRRTGASRKVQIDDPDQDRRAA